MGDALNFPQLRVRTEFSFREAYGPLPVVASALAELGCFDAAMVDPNTWGHVRWQKACEAVGVRPMFGTSLPVKKDDGTKPLAWCIAEDTRGFYQLSSAARLPDADVPALFAASRGVIRFAGSALDDPATFDYIDVNPASILAQRRALALHKHTGKPLVITSDNFYPLPQHFDAFMALDTRERVTPQHILTLDELRAALPCLTEHQFRRAVNNTREVAWRAAISLPTAPLISIEGDLRAAVEAGRIERLNLGHLAEWTEEYRARLARELEVIQSKRYESYFLVVADLVRWAKQRMLVGPGRGSAAGSLVCYLLRITEVDPIAHGLLFERFLDITRSDLPDIDVDFSDVHRDECFAYLIERYGRENVARVGNINTLQPKSVMAKVCEKLGIPPREKFDVYNVLLAYPSGDPRHGHALEDTFAQTEPGRRFVAKYPQAMALAALERHASHTGIHAAGVLVCNEPITHYCTVGADGVAQIDKPQAEALNLLKIDALGLRTLGVIEDAGVVSADELYALTLDDPEVFAIFNQQRYTGIFQFEGQAQRRVASGIHIDSFQRLDHITALARPGPLSSGAADRYARRAAGTEDVTFHHPSMAAYLGPTLGIILYQEQVMQIAAEIGGFDWKEVSALRKAVSSSKGGAFLDKMLPDFLLGAGRLNISPDVAREIWQEIRTFGGYGMNKSHTVSYTVVSYWCAWMKRYHAIEFAAASLRGAKDDDHALSILREVVAEGVPYVAFDIERSGVDWQAIDGVLVGGFKNLVGIGPAKAVAAVEARRLGKLDPAKYLKLTVKFAQIYPLREKYGPLFDDPEAHGCSEGSRICNGSSMPPEGDTLYIGTIVTKSLRDENEALRVARRDGRRIVDQSLFVDLLMRDDSGIPVTIRIDRFRYLELGTRAMDELRAGDDIMVRGKRIPGFAMIKAVRIRCLNRPEVMV